MISDNLRIFLQLAANILGAGFVIFIGAAQLGEYFVDRRIRHIFAAMGWFVLVPIFVLRTMGVIDPPLLAQEVIADGVTIGWAVALLFGMTWAALRSWENYRAYQARQRLQNGHNGEGH